MNAVKNPAPQHTFALIQLTRIGDVLQTLQAASAFKYQYPHVKLILIARRQFSEGLNFLLRQVFDEIHTFNLKDFYGTDNTQDLNTIIKNIDAFVTDVTKNNNIDVLINLSFSKSSSYLAGLIPARHKMGLVRDRTGEFAIKDQWSQYVYSTVMAGPNNPFNLVDIFRKMMGTTQIPLIFGDENKPSKATKKIIIHPFASSKKKRWGITKWSEVIYQLLKTIPQSDVHIMGGPGDQDEAKSLESSPILGQFKNRLHFRVGTYTLEESFYHFSDADLFLGHDSMGGHMAAIHAVPSITLSLGTVRPHETTPYGQNNYNIAPRIKCYPCFPDEKCDLLPCHTNISYQAVVGLAQNILEGETVDHKSLTQKISSFHLDSIHVYQSQIDPVNGLSLYDLTKNPMGINELFKNFYQVLWSFIIAEQEVKLPRPELNKELLSHLVSYQNGLAQLYELNNFGMKYSQYIMDETKANSPRINLIREYSTKLTEIDQLTKVLKNQSPLLAPLIDFYFVAKANLKGNNIVELAESSYVKFFEFNNATQVMAELVQGCLNSSQAKLLKNNTGKTTVVDN